MFGNTCGRCGSAWWPNFVVRWTVAAMWLAGTAEAAPFAYVTSANNIAVIDTANRKMVATIPSGQYGHIAVSPDGKHAYKTGGGVVSVIDTATNSVIATIKAGTNPAGIAVAPDGKHVYVTSNYLPGNCTNPPCSQDVWVIDTTTNVAAIWVQEAGFSHSIDVMPNSASLYVPLYYNSAVGVFGPPLDAVIPVGDFPEDVAITPNGKRAYVANQGSGTVSVIDTSTKLVVATVPLDDGPNGVAITPDGKHAYVSTLNNGTVAVIDTATNIAVAKVTVADYLQGGVAVTPDGKHVYIAGNANVYVIATANNAIVATVPGGGSDIAIVPPPPGVPFLAFSASAAIRFSAIPGKSAFLFRSGFILSSTASNGIDPPAEAVTLQTGTFTATIPPGSFKRHGEAFFFEGTVSGARLMALLRPAGTLRYAFFAAAQGADLTGSKNPIQVSLTIGGDSGTTSIMARIIKAALR